ncbi:hypothetical protein BDF14DRAFT_1757571 [Spinellus fusiger]|nr:hypothetical protein BDF14DRAFT_1757571 [Spinellus fusiger]
MSTYANNSLGSAPARAVNFNEDTTTKKIMSPIAMSPLDSVNAAMGILTDRMTNLLSRMLNNNLSDEERERARHEYAQSITDLENCSKSRKLLVGSATPIMSTPSVSSLLVPTDLPLFQWGNQVVDKSKPVFKTVEDFLARFEFILSSHNQNLDSNWFRLLPKCLTSSQLGWFNKVLGDKSFWSWKKASGKLLANYGPDDALREYNASNSLMNIKMKDYESVEAFTNRFHKTRMASNFADDRLCAHLFANRLTPLLSSQVLVYFADTSKVMSSVEPVALIARNIYHNIYGNQELAVVGSGAAAAARGARIPNTASSRGSKGYKSSAGSVVSGASAINRLSHGVVKKYCEIHKKNMTHTTKDCQVMKDTSSKLATQKKWSPGTSSSGVKKGGICGKCKSPYFPGHRDMCSALSAELAGPVSSMPPLAHRATNVGNVLAAPSLNLGAETQRTHTINWESNGGVNELDGQASPHMFKSSYSPVVVPTTTTLIGTAESSAELARLASQCKYTPKDFGIYKESYGE